MSRSNPQSSEPNPACRWFEWRGKDGHLEYYDKAKEEVVIVPLPFRCIVLDRTATVRGYNNRLKSGLYSNEVRDTRSDPFVVKLFKGNQIVAEGLWANIKDKVTSRSMGGVFATNCYVAFMDQTELKLGAFQISGCAIGPWFDFEKEHRGSVDDPMNPGKRIQELFARAVVINKGKPNLEGDIKFTPPVYTMTDIKPETNARAIELDRQLQKYFTGYFARNTIERTAPAADTGRPTSEPAGQAEDEVCPTCHQPMPADGSPCPACAGDDVPF
jgi:hypothetical protein